MGLNEKSKRSHLGEGTTKSSKYCTEANEMNSGGINLNRDFDPYSVAIERFFMPVELRNGTYVSA